jgi:RNA polymerase sigma-70 factor (ECF subfamily)
MAATAPVSASTRLASPRCFLARCRSGAEPIEGMFRPTGRPTEPALRDADGIGTMALTRFRLEPLYCCIGPGGGRIHPIVQQPELSDGALSELANRAKGGDPTATERLFLLLLPRVRNLVRYLVRGDRDVDDLSQDALVMILKGMHGYRADGPFRAWVDRVVARSVFATLKRRASAPPVAAGEDLRDEHGGTLGGQGHEAYYMRRKLVDWLDRLPEAQRVALVLHYVMGLTIPEAATELGIAEETLRSRLRLAKDRMRSLIEDVPRQQGVI